MSSTKTPVSADALSGSLHVRRVNETHYRRTFSADEITGMIKDALLRESGADPQKDRFFSLSWNGAAPVADVALVVQEPAE